MELSDYIAILRKRWISIVAITLAGLVAAGAITFASTPIYQASAQVYVSVRGTSNSSELFQGSNFIVRQVKSYSSLVSSPRVLQPVIDELDLDTTPEELGERVTAASPLDTVLINITARDEDADLSSQIANATARSLAAQVSEIERLVLAEGVEGGESTSPVQISTVRESTPPTEPASPKTTINLALGLLIGLALGVGTAILRSVLDTRVRTEADVNKVTESSVIGTIIYDEDAPDHPLIVQTNPRSHRAEAFRRLRTNLQFLNIGDRPQSIVVTSALPGEGKSTTTVNLAISLADAGSRVALIDADLRRPSLAKYMGIEGQVGLTTVLIGRADVADVIQPWGNGYLHVLPSGQIPPNPSELLGSHAMAALLERLTNEYDVVLVDTAPLLPVTDAAILAKLTGGALVVVGADKLHEHQLAEAIGALKTVDARILGVVLNRLARKQSDSYSYYDYASETDGGSRRGGARLGTVRRSAPALGSSRAAAASQGTPAGGEQQDTVWPGESFTRRGGAS